MVGLHLRLLGRPVVTLDESPLTAFSTAKTEALLYYLAVTRRPHSRDVLAQLFWGDMPDDKARRNLTKALSTLRGLLEPYLLFERQSVAFHLAAPHVLDVARFEAAAVQTRAGTDPALWAAAAALYQGEFLEGFFVKDAQAFTEWALVERERLRELALRVLDELVAHAARQGDYAAGVHHARRLLELDPWRESAHRQLIHLLGRLGQHSAALAQYEKVRQLLCDELDVEPMAETTALYERIQVARLTSLRSLPAEVEPFVGRTAALTQLRAMLTDPACRLVTLVGIGGIGKTRLALAAARHLNAEGALQFINGAAFVPLVDVPTPADLPAALASALDVPLTGPARPAAAVIDWLRNKEMLLVLDNFEHLVDAAGWLTQLLSACPHVKLLATSREPLHLAAEWRLIVEGLDYPRPTATHDYPHEYEAAQLFAQAARQAAGPGFALTPADAPHIYHLSQLVAGAPLALKLAAAWVRLMPVEQIVAEVERSLDLLATPLRDVPPRQRSLRAVFDCAFERLTPAEQGALAALSVFRGGFRPAAAQPVAGAPLPLLAALVDRSLVQAAPNGRYDLHALLRQFGAERLAQSPEVERAARRAHSAYYLDLLQAHAPALNGPGQPAAVAALAEELENIQAAWRWAAQAGHLSPDLSTTGVAPGVGAKRSGGAALAPALDLLFRFFQMRSHIQEGHDLFGWTAALWQSPAHPLLAPVLARCGAFGVALQSFDLAREHLHAALALSADPREQAFVQLQLGWLAIDHGDRTAGEAHMTESLALSRAHGDQFGEAEALCGLAKAAFESGDFVPAQALSRQGLALCRALGRPDRVAAALGLLAWPTNCLGGYAESEACWREALALNRALGDRLGAAMSTQFLAWCAWCVGGTRLPEAIALYEDVLCTYRELGTRQWLAMCLGDLALATSELGDGALALRYAREGLAHAEAAGIHHLLSYNRAALGAAACQHGDLPAARLALTHALRTGLTLAKKDSVMLALFYFGRLLLKEAAAAAAPSPHAQPLDLLALVIQHPATWQPIRDRATHLRAELLRESGEAAPAALAKWELAPEWGDVARWVGDAVGELQGAGQ